LTRSRERGTSGFPTSRGGLERHLGRRREEDESREIWHDFEQTRPVADPDRPPEVTEPEPTDVREEIAIAER
jgi:hypothetical protein